MSNYFTTEELKTKKFPYSKQAFADGYDFSELSPKDQELTKHYYTSREDMHETYCRYKSADYYIKNRFCPVNIQYSPYTLSWGFPNSGVFNGIIVGCNPTTKKDSSEYILDVLIAEYCIKHIKFDPYKNSKISQSIMDEFGTINSNVLSTLTGKWIQISVKNLYHDDKMYSFINELVFFTDESMEIYLKMFDCMFTFRKKRFIEKNKSILFYGKEC